MTEGRYASSGLLVLDEEGVERQTDKNNVVPYNRGACFVGYVAE
jgi:hypothetical protein